MFALFQGYKERNAYIVAQSPMTSTVVDMWRLLYDHESHTVIMLDVESDTDDVSGQCVTYTGHIHYTTVVCKQYTRPECKHCTTPACRNSLSYAICLQQVYLFIFPE